MSYPPIPEQGLSEVLSKWIGRGTIWDAIAAPKPSEEQDWSASDLKSRAHRILLERLVPALGRWPRSLRHWIDLLPAAKTHGTIVQSVPFSGVSWTNTRINYGWPATAFTGRESQRGADMSLVTVLRWTLEQLEQIRGNAIRAFPDVDRSVLEQLDACARLFKIEPLVSATSLRPRRQELQALRREGSPWGAVVDVAAELRSADASLDYLGSQLLMPDDGIRWRLFHLAILGELLTSLRTLGCTIRSLGPLTGGSTGPSYEIVDAHGRSWSLWFEASGIWANRAISAPYGEATRGIGASRALGADLLLIRGHQAALIIECKYSEFREVVARNGYYQATTYAAEVCSRLAKDVTSVAIGPEGVVKRASFTQTDVGMVGTAPPSAIFSITKPVIEKV
jgi:hypothetical protein